MINIHILILLNFTSLISALKCIVCQEVYSNNLKCDSASSERAVCENQDNVCINLVKRERGESSYFILRDCEPNGTCDVLISYPKLIRNDLIKCEECSTDFCNSDPEESEDGNILPYNSPGTLAPISLHTKARRRVLRETEGPRRRRPRKISEGCSFLILRGKVAGVNIVKLVVSCFVVLFLGTL